MRISYLELKISLIKNQKKTQKRCIITGQRVYVKDYEDISSHR